MRPAKEIVICEPVAQETRSGIFVSVNEDKTARKTEIGRVIAIGKGELPIEIKVGDVIVHRKYTDNRVAIDGKEYNFIEFKNIVAIKD